jgi:membrane protease YdiL (CAAX protease family)
MNGDRCDNSPCYWELVSIIAAGAIHVTAEVVFSETTSRLCNAAISLVFVGYVVWRVRTSAGILRTWGMRTDNFAPAIVAHLGFAAFGALALFGLAATTGSVEIPASFWVAVGLYPIYGVVQQFALQNLIARNLRVILSGPVAVAATAAVLFGLSHFPRLDLVALTFVAGFFFTLIYQRFSNLWAVGIAHGLVAALVMYLVLGEDPGAEILMMVGLW